MGVENGSVYNNYWLLKKSLNFGKCHGSTFVKNTYTLKSFVKLYFQCFLAMELQECDFLVCNLYNPFQQMWLILHHVYMFQSTVSSPR